MQTPVAMFVYHRPAMTERVFAQVARARPPVLLVVADGPVSMEDGPACEATRAVVGRVDWPCDVRHCFATSNMGCRVRVASGLDWVFNQVGEAIILEDDTVPHPDFFPFCEEMLVRYHDDLRVGHIGGTDHNNGDSRGDGSYYFSRYTSIWGWATWRRCWKSYDVSISRWPVIKASGEHRTWFSSPEEADHFTDVWDDIHAGRIDTWDAQWLFCRLSQGTLAITPNGNLITNIGFHDEATHTHDVRHPFANLPVRSMPFPLRHPREVLVDEEADRRRAATEFLRRPPWAQQWRRRLGNRHWYGSKVRAMPIVGRYWAAWRRSRGGPSHGGGAGTLP